jgi:hypothetical protein
MNTIGNKKLELFDMGAGASEPTAGANVQLASGNMFNGIYSSDQLVDISTLEYTLKLIFSLYICVSVLTRVNVEYVHCV